MQIESAVGCVFVDWGISGTKKENKMSKCKICSKWFILTDQRLPYEGGFAHHYHFNEPNNQRTVPQTIQQTTTNQTTQDTKNDQLEEELPIPPPTLSLRQSSETILQDQNHPNAWSCLVCQGGPFPEWRRVCPNCLSQPGQVPDPRMDLQFLLLN